MSDIVVLFDTDDYRGDHSADVTYTLVCQDTTTLRDVVEHAERCKGQHSKRATVRIVPSIDVLEAEDE